MVRQPAIRFANQALFHPLKYIKGLAEAVNSDGSAIFGRSEATEVHSEPLSLVVGKHKVRCQTLIIATHVPLIGEASLPRATLLQSKLAGYSTYAIAALAPKRSLPAASFWDTDDPDSGACRDSAGGSLVFVGDRIESHMNAGTAYLRRRRAVQPDLRRFFEAADFFA